MDGVRERSWRSDYVVRDDLRRVVMGPGDAVAPRRGIKMVCTNKEGKGKGGTGKGDSCGTWKTPGGGRGK